MSKSPTQHCSCHSQSQLPSKFRKNNGPVATKARINSHLPTTFMYCFSPLPSFSLSSPHYKSYIHPNAHLKSQPVDMDWFSWLSKTNLHPSLIYDYGLTFARNELQLEDAAFFNHEFLQSMGISIAKHRLEILKLVHSEYRGRRPNNKLSGVIKTCLRKCVRKLGFREEASVKRETPEEPNWHYQEKWRGAMVRKQGAEEVLKESNDNNNNNKPINRSRTIALSGPLDGRMNEKVVPNNKMLRLSGPLDGRMSDRMMHANQSPLVTRQIMGSVRSPRSSEPLDPRLMIVDGKSPMARRPSDARAESPMCYSPYVNKAEADFDYDGDDHALWPTLFQDLKPT